MKRKEFLVLILMSLMLTLIAGCIESVTPDVTETVRYVATNGDNAHDGSEEFPWRTIQYALTTIPKSGTIIVKDGVYNESISFPSVWPTKKIILQSVNGDSSTTIIGYSNLPTVTCSNSFPGTTLEGFTITHNPGDNGSGIYISAGCLNIDNCTISNNSATFGGGIYNKCILSITSSTISNNSADQDEGGGIYNCGTLTINRGTIISNSAHEGGGIYNCGTLTITEESTISHNFSFAEGGGIHNCWGTLTINSSTISHNSVDYSYGGGIHNFGTLTINSSTISHNFSAYDGGGIHNLGTLTINSSTISHNSAAFGGGIGNRWGGTLTINSSTISYNSAHEGGGIYFFLGSETATIGSSGEENTICGNYKTGNTPSLDQQIRGESGSLYDTYNNTNFISASCPL